MSAAEDAQGSLHRPAAVVTAVLSGVTLVVLAAFLVPWTWVPHGHLVAAAPTDVFTAGEIARAEQYAGLTRVLALTSYAVSLGVALLLGLTSLGARVVRSCTRRLRWWLAVPVGVGVVLAVGRLATLPFSVALWRRRLDYGLTNQGLAGWSADLVKAFLVSWVITSLLLLVLVGAARRFPRSWFAWAGGAAAVLTVVVSFLYPVVVEPVFNKFTPLHAGPFRESVMALARHEGVAIDDILVADASRRTTTLNAYVSGFGGTRRLVVYDTLLRDLSASEARSVIAHELGHAKHGDVLLGTMLGAIGAVFGVSLLALLLDSKRLLRRAGARGPGDPAVVALVLALTALGGFLASPVENAVSRAIEVRADRDALAATGDGATFVRMQRELAVHALSDPTPPRLVYFWFGTHPTVIERAGLPSSLARSAR